ncbi:MAG: tRNA threonylcarbamoyladenosine dehydratase [Bacteroidales bacterium]|jgi:tRNA A37 threonylcarbamoyladenosine dehydratase|nr:tRNA threonylcarbamoyladenosine dehydratase [Bacteroidales bacterium]
MKGLFNRTELLLGKEVMKRMETVKVIVFGIGGVGGWCAESLVRSGICHLTIVDSDRVCVTNLNRQVMATTQTVGKVKVEVLKQRLLEINPAAEITAMQMIYSQDTAADFHLEEYDYILDAIDSLAHKVDLMVTATQYPAKFFSSMGAALKIDASRIKITEFWKVNGCPLAALIRKRMKRRATYPAKKFLCVYSDEVLENKGVNTSCGLEQCLCPKSDQEIGNPDLTNHEWCSLKARINGTSSHIPAIFGFMMAGLVVQDVYAPENKM